MVAPFLFVVECFSRMKRITNIISYKKNAFIQHSCSRIAREAHFTATTKQNAIFSHGRKVRFPDNENSLCFRNQSFEFFHIFFGCTTWSTNKYTGFWHCNFYMANDSDTCTSDVEMVEIYVFIRGSPNLCMPCLESSEEWVFFMPPKMMLKILYGQPKVELRNALFRIR